MLIFVSCFKFKSSLIIINNNKQQQHKHHLPEMAPRHEEPKKIGKKKQTNIQIGQNRSRESWNIYIFLCMCVYIRFHILRRTRRRVRYLQSLSRDEKSLFPFFLLYFAEGVFSVFCCCNLKKKNLKNTGKRGKPDEHKKNLVWGLPDVTQCAYHASTAKSAPVQCDQRS